MTTPDQVNLDNLTVRATEHYAFGFIDRRIFNPPGPTLTKFYCDCGWQSEPHAGSHSDKSAYCPACGNRAHWVEYGDTKTGNFCAQATIARDVKRATLVANLVANIAPKFPAP